MQVLLWLWLAWCAGAWGSWGAWGARVPHTRRYHAAAGIAAAARLRRLEAGLDVDGSRITGGHSVSAGTQPHLGGMVIDLTTGQQTVCGCSLLNHAHALTAAHCWWDGEHQARLFTVVYGSARLFSGGLRLPTDRVAVHEGWDPDTITNDVAVITHAHVAFNDYIQPINLPSGIQLNNNFVGSWATTAGFGRICDSLAIGPQQDKRQVTLQVITNAECARTFGNVVASTLCVSGAGGSTCAGDSGGPLAIGSGATRTLIGVTSFGAEPGCTHGFPAAFARVTAYAAWIRERI